MSPVALHIRWNQLKVKPYLVATKCETCSQDHIQWIKRNQNERSSHASELLLNEMNSTDLVCKPDVWWDRLTLFWKVDEMFPLFFPLNQLKFTVLRSPCEPHMRSWEWPQIQRVKRLLSPGDEPFLNWNWDEMSCGFPFKQLKCTWVEGQIQVEMSWRWNLISLLNRLKWSRSRAQN